MKAAEKQNQRLTVQKNEPCFRREAKARFFLKYAELPSFVQIMERPPSTMISVPVMKEDRREARNRAVSAISEA